MEIAGKKVVDARKPIVIEVTREDCRKGKTRDPAGCAAARSILHTDEKALSARVHRGMTYVEYEEKWVRYRTSSALSFELAVFDRGTGFEPGAYGLGVPSASHSIASERARLEGLPDNRKNRPHRDPNARKRHRHDITHTRTRGANR